MSQNDPEVLRAEIERTRAELSNNVDTLTDTANPKNIAHRQADKVKSAARGVREHLMGAPDDPYDAGTLGDRRAAVQDKVGAVQDRAAGALDTVADAPAQAKRKTRGNPLAAGLIAFGVGYASIAWLLRYVENHTIYVFVWYRIILGLAVLLAVLGGLVPAT